VAGPTSLTIGLNGTAAGTFSLAIGEHLHSGLCSQRHLQVNNTGALNGNAVVFGSASTEYCS